MAWSSDLARTKTWGNETLTAADLHAQFDLIINWVMAALNGTTGHGHAGTQNDGKKLTSAAFSADCITFAAIDDDGDFGLFTGDWSFNEIALVEDTAPTTAASEGKLYTKDSGGQPELFFREESDGDEVQITKAGSVGIAGTIVGVSYSQRQDEVACSTAIPANNSSRTSSEGDQVLTVNHTPKSNSNILKITVNVNYMSASPADNCMILLDGTTVLATSRRGYASAGVFYDAPATLVYYMTSPGTSQKTFNVRCGGTAAGVLNKSTASMDNGKLISSITVEEIKG